MLKGIVSGSLAVGLALAAPVMAAAPEVQTSSRYALEIVGFVPVICRASVEASMAGVGQGRKSLGALNEFCNSPNGYRVHADYSPSLSNAKLYVDGNPIALDASGTTVISSSTGAAIRSRAVALDLPEAVSGGGRISFRIEPL